MRLVDTVDLDGALKAFMEVNSSLKISKEERKSEGGVWAQIIAEKLNELSPQERHRWTMILLGYLAEATNIAYRKGVQVERMKMPGVN